MSLGDLPDYEEGVLQMPYDDLPPGSKPSGASEVKGTWWWQRLWTSV